MESVQVLVRSRQTYLEEIEPLGKEIAFDRLECTATTLAMKTYEYDVVPVGRVKTQDSTP